MNIEKPYLPVLIICSYEQVPELYSTQKKLHLALQIDLFTSVVDKNLVVSLIEGNTPFMVLINTLNGEINNIMPEMEELIKLCLFSRNYIRHNGTPALAFINAGQHCNTTEQSASSELFIAELQRQGWPAVTKWMLPSFQSFAEQLRQTTLTPFLINKIDVDENLLLHHFFCNPHNTEQYIFFQATELQSAAAIEEDFFRLCESAISRNPLFKLYLTNYLSAKIAATKAANENSILAERLNNAENTIDIIRTKYKGDYDILFNWYQNEYEVLPLWYKRLGHILKAITGKRSFKSLFNDDEKKKAVNY